MKAKTNDPKGRKMTGEVAGDERQGDGELAAAAAAKSLQSCPTLCDPRDGSP